MKFFPLLLIILFLIFPAEAAQGATSALALLGASVIGSLFPFMAASKMLAMSGCLKGNNFFIKAISRIFGISRNGAVCLTLGTVCGYPVGQKLISDAYSEGEITLGEARKLSLFANNAGPAFAVSTVGGAFLGDVKAGAYIYVSVIAASLILGFVLSFFTNRYDMITNTDKPENHELFYIITKSISDGALSMLNVAAVIVFFGALLRVLSAIGIISFAASLFPDSRLAEAVITGIFEITAGCGKISVLTAPLRLKAAVSSALISFSGISVLCQIKTFIGNKKIPMKNIIIFKGISAVISSLICFGLCALI